LIDLRKQRRRVKKFRGLEDLSEQAEQEPKPRTSKIPHLKLDVLILYSLDVEADCCEGGSRRIRKGGRTRRGRMRDGLGIVETTSPILRRG
jgi:hypothetical protein